MKTPIYYIREYDLIGEKLFSYEFLGNFSENEIQVKEDKIISAGIHESNGYHLLSKKPKGFDIKQNKFLPYFADVTECRNIPQQLKELGLKPTTYKNAKLLSEKRGGYILFYHEDHGGQMPIAINHYHYEPSGKVFYTQDNIGTVKYTVSYHDGKKSHKDGSKFFDIATFKNKRKRDQFLNELKEQDYKPRR